MISYNTIKKILFKFEPETAHHIAEYGLKVLGGCKLIKDPMEKKNFISDKKLIYILERLDRSFESVIKVIDRLDTHSLEFDEKVTYKNIKIILDSLKED